MAVSGSATTPMAAGALARASKWIIQSPIGQSGYPQAALFLILEETMSNDAIPLPCLHCIERFQANCPHLDTYFSGQFHYGNGEVWDDIHETCDDCGANLDRLPHKKETTSLDDEEIPF
jgi:hypothetical protein